MPPPKDLVSDQLRRFIADEPGSLEALGREAGVSGPVLSRFAGGLRGLTLDSVDKIAGALGLRLVQTRRRGRRA
jgi:hypothetical protein